MNALVSDGFRSIRYGVETLGVRAVLPRHRHVAGYATVVLEGAFDEASFAGRSTVEAGEVLLHGRFDCHANVSVSRRAPRILRLPWDDDSLEGRFHVNDPDGLARVCERAPLLAMRQLRAALIPVDPRPMSWAERLAMDIRVNPSIRIQEWAEREGLAPPTVSRGFRATFGTSPQRYRLEVRTRRAWGSIVSSPVSLTTIAHRFGFADLAHLTRSVHAFTGIAPSSWRNTESADSNRGMLSTFKRAGILAATLAERDSEPISKVSAYDVTDG
jgi:AraC-like DNA-binding protein